VEMSTVSIESTRVIQHTRVNTFVLLLNAAPIVAITLMIVKTNNASYALATITYLHQLLSSNQDAHAVVSYGNGIQYQLHHR